MIVLKIVSHRLTPHHHLLLGIKGRKKKSITTINSINPGRAPVGFLSACPSESESPRDGNVNSPLNQSETADKTFGISRSLYSLNLSPLVGEEQANMHPYPRPLTESNRNFPLALPPFIHAPAPTSTDPRVAASFAQTQPATSSDYATGLIFPQHPPRSVGTTPIPRPPPMARTLSSDVPVAPPYAYNTRVTPHPSVAASAPSFGSQARAAELNAAAAARARNVSRELEDINSLASSKPIPLSDLTSKTHTRNRGSKSFKPFSFEDIQNFTSADFPPRGGNQHATNSSSQPPGFQGFDPSHANMNPHPLRGVTGPDLNEHNNVPTGPRHQTPRWIREVNSHMQGNNMDPTAYYDPGYGNPGLQRPPATFPPPKAFVNLRGPRLLGPEDMSPSKQEEKSVLRGGPHNTVSQNPLHEDPCMAGQPYHPYGPQPFQFGTQHDANVAFGYGAPPMYDSPQTTQMALDYRFPHHGAHGEINHHGPYGLAAPLAPQAIVNPQSHRHGSMSGGGSVMYTEIVKPIATPMSASVSSRSSKSIQPLAAVESKEPQPQPHKNPAKEIESSGTKRDMTAYLNSVVEASKANLGKKTNQDGGNAAEPGTLHSKNQSSKSSEPHDALDVKAGNGPPPPQIGIGSAPVQKPTESVLRDANSRQPSLHNTAPEAEHAKGHKVDVKGKGIAPRMVEPDSGMPFPMPDPAMFATSATTAPMAARASSFLFPPPGLPYPKYTGPPLEPLDEPLPAPGSRLDESNRWYHSDGRGEEELRKRITAITRADSLKRKEARGSAPKTKDDKIADASNILLGGVLANLQSYLSGDPKDQFGNFAKFGNVPDSCVEPSHGGRRSFFDQDPFDSWGLPPSLSERRYRAKMNAKGQDGKGPDEAKPSEDQTG